MSLDKFLEEDHKLHDEECQKIIDKNPNMLIPWYLIASYAYYQEDSPIISDGLFDKICKKALQNWRIIEHRHKHLVTESDLTAGTCLLAGVKYPSIVISVATGYTRKT